MGKNFQKRVMSCLLVTIITIALLQGFSFAKSENLQILKKSDEAYLIYINPNLLDQTTEFEFAFSNEADVEKSTLTFISSALDSTENGNYIAYVDDTFGSDYFTSEKNTYLWVKQDEEYILSAEEVKLSDAISEDEIQSFNSITKTITVTVGEKETSIENEEGVKITNKIGTLEIEDKTGTYYYQKLSKVTEGSEEEALIELANSLNTLENESMFNKLSVYNNFKELYNQLKPEVNDSKWIEVEDYSIEQPEDSKAGDQYLVWLKKDLENTSIIDVQIMTCDDGYIPEYETQNVVVKKANLLPTTGDNAILFIIAGIILVLIIAVVVLKLRNRKDTQSK